MGEICSDTRKPFQDPEGWQGKLLGQTQIKNASTILTPSPFARCWCSLRSSGEPKPQLRCPGFKQHLRSRRSNASQVQLGNWQGTAPRGSLHDPKGRPQHPAVHWGPKQSSVSPLQTLTPAPLFLQFSHSLKAVLVFKPCDVSMNREANLGKTQIQQGGSSSAALPCVPPAAASALPGAPATRGKCNPECPVLHPARNVV